MTTTVKHFHSAMTGAPVLSGTAGSLIAVLDACLVNGFGLKTADSVVVSGGIATATFSTGHSFEPDVIALVTGATPAGLNGEKTVLTTSTNTITFDATGIADGAATGAITFKLAPAGWAKAFSAANIAAYRADDPTGTRMFLRVDDTGTQNARVVGYESMTDVSAGAGPFPTSVQVAGGGWWPKANEVNATAHAWTLFSDSRGFLLHIHCSQTNAGAAGAIWGFGDFSSYKSGDAYSAALWATIVDESGSASVAGYSAEFVGPSPTVGPHVARSYTALGGALLAHQLAESYFTGSGASGAVNNSTVPKYPNGPNNGLVLARKLLVEPGEALRGVARGLFLCPQVCHTQFAWRDKISGQGDLAGRKLMAVKCGAPNGSASSGVVFIDITGPWGD